MDIATSGITLRQKTKSETIELLLGVLLNQEHNYLTLYEPRDQALCRTLMADTFPTTLDETQYCSIFRD